MSVVKRRILLVDDESRIVQGLQRALRMHREGWDVQTATSGAAALTLFDTAPIDVIISDMRMPEMDGATLLAEVKHRYPGTLRIVLSGQTDAEAAFRALPVAHQFLSKPTDPSTIGEILTRTADMKSALPDPLLHDALGAIDALPTPRLVRDELLDGFARGADVSSLTAIIERDPSLILKLLQTVNSAFFGLRHRVCDTGEAIAYLGVDLVRVICTIGETSESPVRARAVAIANLARQIAGGEERGAVAYAASLFSTIGPHLISLADPDLPASLEVPVVAYLLDLWGIPRVIVDALLEVPSIEPGLAHRTRLMPADAIFIARRVFENKPVALDYLERLGVVLPQAA